MLVTGCAAVRLPQTFLAGACPTIGSYGAKDWTLSGAADRLERALTSNGVEHNIKQYPGAGHAFLNDHQDGSGV